MIRVRFLRRFVLAAAAACLCAGADVPTLLQTAVGKWTSGQEDWSFLRKTRIYSDDGTLKREKVESYDPSQPDERRWRLLSVDGHPPDEAELAAERKKNARPRRYGSDSTGRLLDLDHAVVREETPATVTYEIPIRGLASKIAQTDKLVVLITVDRKTETAERLTARLLGPMRIALGLAHITDVDMDLNFDSEGAAPGAETAPTSATARATLSAFGQRMEYEWADLKPVPVYHGGR